MARLLSKRSARSFLGLSEKYPMKEDRLRFFVVRVGEPTESPEEAEEYLAELRFLVESAGYTVGAMHAYKWRRPDPATYLTKGRI
jgi:50S ribosomal subunit-associated GTPase HflX